MNTILARGGGNLNDPIFKSSNARGLPGVYPGGGGMLKFRFDRCIIAPKMVLVYKDMQISTLEDIQKLKVKDLREILRSNSETTGGMKADLVLKVYALLMRNELRSAENQQQNVDDGADNHQDNTENRGDFKYDEV